MLRIGIIIGSTRPNRVGAGVAEWVMSECRKRFDAEFEVVDLKDFNLPLLDEPVPAGMSSNYTKPHTKAWSTKIQSFDAFVFVTPEYNHGYSAALKNALDYLYTEWNNKAAGFVSYGGVGGARSVEQLRAVMVELQIATVRTQLTLNLKSDFENYSVLKPQSFHVKILNQMLDQLVSWGSAFARLRHEADGEEKISGPAPEVDQEGEITNIH